ncbi:high mobility group B protein 9-like [Lotus japonicus]|uniref:high mobility group B protein 9-like n=1 Tax=Lotus japonicus TaxID=34305 RepID=UPI00258B4F6C|nr:high mobility group B protein 9-like [Lotus japonicus]
MSSATRTIGSGGDDGKLYPPPLASHEVIVNDAKLFLDTLKQFHFHMGSKYMIPVIGGRKLDLHTLYVEVTRRSGYEKVVAEKKWREVGSVFNFSTTTTSASYVLKKHYWNLLYDFEQVHFFKVQGPITPPADVLSGSSSSGKPDLALAEYAPKHANNGPESNVEAKGYPRYGEGTIEEKIDCGYLVSVKLGSEVLRGVIFHPEETVPPPSSRVAVTGVV